MNDLISVIIPVYNVEEYIRECLDSVINQTYKNLEIILIDDGSKDNSGKICDEYAKKDKRIKVIHKENGGLSSARNKGLDNAQGKYITFVDSDDYIPVNAIELLYKNCISNEADCSIGGVQDIKDGQVVYVGPKKQCCLSKEEALKYFFVEKYFKCIACSKMYKKELIGTERFDETIRLVEDFYFTYNILKKVNKVSLNTKDIVYCYRIRSGSLMHQKYNKKFENEIDYSENVLNDVKKNYPKLEKHSIRRYQRVIVSCIDKYFREKEEVEGIKYLLDRLNKYPNKLDLFQRIKLFMLLKCNHILKVIYVKVGKM
ncbi:MAG: glycosyltransferase family 2 protein [Clostridia bacterium]|nr:glycosyltransferase family 2 protein [Clostridia bacterium]